MKVIVLVIPERKANSRIRLIKRKFRSELFEVIDLSDQLFNNTVSVVPGMTQEEIDEANKVMFALEFSYENHRDNPVIIIKNTSTSNVSSNHIEKMTTELLNIDQNRFDMCYYCKWLDQCQLYTPLDNNIETLLLEDTTIVKTFSPNGIQTIYFTTHGRDKILVKNCMKNGKDFQIVKPLDIQFNDEIFNGNLIALAMVPNLFQFDIILNVRNNDDYLKVNECLPIEKFKDSDSNVGRIGILIFVIIIIILIAYAMVKLGPK